MRGDFEWRPRRDEPHDRRDGPRGGRDASRRPERDERRHDDRRHDWECAAQWEESRGGRGHDRRAEHGASSRGYESHWSRAPRPRPTEWRDEGRAASARRDSREDCAEPRPRPDARSGEAEHALPRATAPASDGPSRREHEPRAKPYDRAPVRGGDGGPHGGSGARLPQLNAKQLSSYISNARYRCGGVELLGTEALLRLASDHEAALNHIHVGNLWNKLGKQRDAAAARHRAGAERLLVRTRALVSEADAWQLANIAHGLATSRMCGEEAAALFDAVAAAAVGRLRDFNPQALANTVWAYATVGVRAAALLAECARLIASVTAWDADDLT